LGAEDESVSESWPGAERRPKVVSVLALAARPGAEDDLVRAFAEQEVFGHSRRSGGFITGRLLRPLIPGEPFLVIAEWEEPGSYERWLDNPVRDQLSAALQPLLAEHVATGKLYEESL
jgi:heme-degrading monooxygenase HmoA